MAITEESAENTGKNKIDHDVTEFYKFVEEFMAESDRAAVILGAAKLDLLLFQILQRVLRPCTSSKDELLEGDAPLGTFSSRAMMCHRLGLINDELYSAINIVRRIRNSFAHELSGVRLDTGAHRDRIRELTSPIKDHGSFKWLVKDIYTGDYGPGIEFRATVALIALRLEGVFESNITVWQDDPQTLIPPGWSGGEKVETDY